MPFGALHILRRRLHAVCQHQQRDMEGEQTVDAGQTLLVRQALEIKILGAADDLHAVVVEILKKAGERQRRTIDRPMRDQLIQIILGPIDHLQPEFADDLMQLHGIGRRHNIASER